MVQQLTNALDSKESGRRGFSLYPKGANLLTRISIVLFSTYFALKIAFEIYFAIDLYPDSGRVFHSFLLVSYALPILVLLIVILMSKGKSNLSFILSLLIFLVFLLEIPNNENLDRSVDIISFLSILTNYSNYPNMTPFALFLFSASALLGALLCSALICLVLGRVNRKK
jgi:hypothetical protein